jgi:xanthine dehydrogenase accessory factor
MPHPAPRLVRLGAAGASLLERLDPGLPPLWLYGAGHVGQALARILAELPVRLTWIDSRAGLVPAAGATPRWLYEADPAAAVGAAPPGTYFVVLTHSHPLDYALCGAILRRKDFAWVGLIGSMSKAARFRARLARDGFTADLIARLICPIGIAGIASKWPAAIAVGVAAQVLRAVSAAEGDAAAAAVDDAAMGNAALGHATHGHATLGNAALGHAALGHATHGRAAADCAAARCAGCAPAPIAGERATP